MRCIGQLSRAAGEATSALLIRGRPVKTRSKPPSQASEGIEGAEKPKPKRQLRVRREPTS